ncbi:hypothetical protein NW754_011302 [Fusarium falciforme]|nr:hypothetical protein NW754_011302 [Fusarium falciforme]
MTRRTDREPRVRRSCERCRQKKIKCPAEKPGCSHCHLANSPCVYLPRNHKTSRSLRQQLPEPIQQLTSPGCRAIYRRSEQPGARPSAKTNQFTSFSTIVFINGHRPICMVSYNSIPASNGPIY